MPFIFFTHYHNITLFLPQGYHVYPHVTFFVLNPIHVTSNTFNECNLVLPPCFSVRTFWIGNLIQHIIPYPLPIIFWERKLCLLNRLQLPEQLRTLHSFSGCRIPRVTSSWLPVWRFGTIPYRVIVFFFHPVVSFDHPKSVSVQILWHIAVFQVIVPHVFPPVFLFLRLC